MHDDSYAKLRLLTYTRLSLERCCLNPATLEKQCPLDIFSSGIGFEALAAGLIIADTNTPFGSLERLPLELLQDTLYNLDLQSLTTFRSVSKRVRYIVSNIPRYHTIIRHIPNALRFMLSTRTASLCTLSELYDALLSRKCFVCGKFGGFLSVLNYRRCCFHCITYSKELFPLTIRGVQTRYMLDKASIATLPLAVTLPGRYGLYENLSRKRNRLVLEASARQAAIAFHGSECKMMIHISRETAKRAKRAADKKKASPGDPSPTLTPRSSGASDGYHMGSNNPIRCQTIVRFPTLEASTGNLEWGMACQGCRGNLDRHVPWEDSYTLLTDDQYPQHFDQCDFAQKRWQEYRTLGGEMKDSYWPGTTKRSSTIIRPK